MENILIWIITLLLAVIIIVPYFVKFRRQQQYDQKRKEEAVRLGADRAIAQHPQIDQIRCIGCGACVAACPEGDVLGIVAGKATVINGLKCVGHGRCAEACPVEGITIGLGDISGRDDIPALSEQHETNIPGMYIVGELGGLALIKNAIEQGSRVADFISGNAERSRSKDIYDVIIVGAGPAGMSSAMSFISHDMNYLLIDQQDAGGTILQYPRKKLVMTRPVSIPLYGTLERGEYTKEELLDIWYGLKDNYSLNLRTNEKLTDIKKPNGHFEVYSGSNCYRGKNVILALGRRGTPRKLNVPGEQQPKVMYKLIDAEQYQGEQLLVVGGGDSAIEAAIGLARQKGNRVTLSYRKDSFFRIKKRNEQRILEASKSGQVRILFNSTVAGIGQKDVSLICPEGPLTIPNDYVFIFAGGEPPFKLLKKIGIRFGAAEPESAPPA